MDQPLTFETLLTAAGAGIAAGLITTLVQLLKGVFPRLFDYLNGAQLAFIFAGLLYVAAAITTQPHTADSLLGVLIAWLTCSAAAVGFYETTSAAVEAVKERADGKD